MRPVIAVTVLALAAVAPGFAVKPCEELKSEIAAKLDAKGVKAYQLDIVAKAGVEGQTVVGSCDGGSKNITYKRGDQAPAKGAAEAEAAAKPPAAPQKK